MNQAKRAGTSEASGVFFPPGSSGAEWASRAVQVQETDFGCFFFPGFHELNTIQ